MLKDTVNPCSGRLRGVSIIESVLVLTVSGGLLLGGVAFFKQANDRQKISEVSQQITSSQAIIRREMANTRALSGEYGDVTPYFVRTRMTTFNPGGADEIIHPWGGNVVIDNIDLDSFSISLLDIPPRICKRLAIEAKYSSTFDAFPLNSVFLVNNIPFALNNQPSLDDAIALCNEPGPVDAGWYYSNRSTLHEALVALQDSGDDADEVSAGSGSGNNPGNSGNTPGNSADNSAGAGNSGNAPGQSGDNPGNSGDTPGNSADNSGNTGNSGGSGNSGNNGNSGNSGNPHSGSGSPGNSGGAGGSGDAPGNWSETPAG